MSEAKETGNCWVYLGKPAQGIDKDLHSTIPKDAIRDEHHLTTRRLDGVTERLFFDKDGRIAGYKKT